MTIAKFEMSVKSIGNNGLSRKLISSNANDRIENYRSERIFCTGYKTTSLNLEGNFGRRYPSKTETDKKGVR